MSRQAAAAPAHRRRGRLAVLVAILLVAAAVLVRTFVAEPFAIPSESMEPTLRPGDHVVVDKLAYRLGAPHRGDVAAFTARDGGTVAVKRIVGLAGDRVAIEDGWLTVDGRRVREPYVDHEQVDSEYFGPIVVPRGHVFVLGDNRADSRDSRVDGPVPQAALIGRVRLRLWPPRR